MSKQTPDLGKPHSIADHEGIVAIQRQRPTESASRSHSIPPGFPKQDIRHIALEHILPERRADCNGAPCRLDGQACEAAAAKLERRIEKVPGVRRVPPLHPGRVRTSTAFGLADQVCP